MAEPGNVHMDPIEYDVDDAVYDEPYYDEYDETQFMDRTVPTAPDPNSQDTLASRIQAIQESENVNKLPGVINIHASEPTAYEKGVIVEHYKNYLTLSDPNYFSGSIFKVTSFQISFIITTILSMLC